MTTQFSFKDLTAKIPHLIHLIHWLAGSLDNSLSHSIRTSIICQQNAIPDNRLRRPLHHFFVTHSEVCCIIFRKRLLSRVHLQKVRSEVGCIRLMLIPSVFKPSVCESQFDLINIFCWYETKNVSGIYRTFHDEDRWSRIRTISKRGQFSCPWHNFPSKNVFFCHREMLFKTLLMAKNTDKYALFLPKLFAHTSSY